MAAAEEAAQAPPLSTAAAAAAETPEAAMQQLELQPMTLADTIAPLAAMPEAERSFSCNALVQCVARLQQCRAMLAARQPAEESLADQERILATWLSAYLAGDKLALWQAVAFAC